MKADDSDDVITDINVTPLVDVCLVLVIIFMVIAPFVVRAGIKSLQAQAKAGVGKVAASENVRVQIKKNGTVSVNGRHTTWNQLSASITKALARSRDRMVIVSANENNRVEQAVTALDIAKQAGAEKVALLKN